MQTLKTLRGIGEAVYRVLKPRRPTGNQTHELIFPSYIKDGMFCVQSDRKINKNTHGNLTGGHGNEKSDGKAMTGPQHAGRVQDCHPGKPGGQWFESR